jgi:hypothetical protein
MNVAAAPRTKILDNPRYKPNPKKRRDESAMIERIGGMNDRHTQALAAGDKGALLELAAEYLVLGNHGGCPGMASRITAEADNL